MTRKKRKTYLVIPFILVMLASNLLTAFSPAMVYAENNADGTQAILPEQGEPTETKPPSEPAPIPAASESEKELPADKGNQQTPPPAAPGHADETNVDVEPAEPQKAESPQTEQKETEKPPLPEQTEAETETEKAPEQAAPENESAEEKTTAAPPLLITEIMPDNAGADEFEYIEVHNPTDKPVILDHYTISLRYPDGSSPDKPAVFRPFEVGSGKTAVLWLNLSNKTLEDFNQKYGVQLTQEQVVEFTGIPNFANGGNRGFAITGLNGDVISASYLGEDISSGKSVQFTIPESGTEMKKLEAKAAPTPGTILESQAPLEIVQTPENMAPSASHEPLKSAVSGNAVSISAVINDDTADHKAILYYRTGDEFKTRPMTAEGNVYSASIPKEELTGKSFFYFIEVTDPNNRVTLNNSGADYEVSIAAPEKPEDPPAEPEPGSPEDYESYPHLLITEISPNSEGAGTDYYEYFEVYNNTDKVQSLSDYSFVYRYTDTGNELPFQLPEGLSINSQESIVLWFNNGDLKTDDFNRQFGTSLGSQNLAPFKDAFPGFSNAGSRGIAIKDRTGAEIISASYLAGETDNSGKTVKFKYPETGTEMGKLQTLADPDPGTFSAQQVPSLPVSVPEKIEDTVKPDITHSQIKEAEGFKDIEMTAAVTDDKAAPFATLFYKAEKDGTFISIPMSADETKPEQFKAIIPGSDVLSDLVYYIEASDGTNTAATKEFKIKVNIRDVDTEKLPPFLVTEVVPDSANVGTADGYEFIEIYNNTNQAVNFKDYKINYRYGMEAATDVVWTSVPEDIVIPSGRTLVFWIINEENKNSSVTDFNKNYGTSLEENKDIVRIYSAGMANGSVRGLAVSTNTNKEISVAYYNEQTGKDDTAADKGIFYTYPSDGSTVQVKVSAGQKQAAPGTVESYQIPKKPVTLKQDKNPPSIQDLTNLTEIDQKEDIHILADAKDDQSVKSVRLFYKVDNQSDYKSAILKENYDDMLYHHTIYSPDLIGNKSVDYYFVVSDGMNETRSNTKTILVTSDFDDADLRLNVKDGDILSKEAILKATAKSGQPEKITMKIDGKEVTDTYRSIERTAYFAFEANGINTYFQNAVTMGEDILFLMDKDFVTDWKTYTVPIEPDRVTGQTTATIRSGNKVSPFDLESAENRDDYTIRNVRLVLSDGTILRADQFEDAQKIMTMNDAHPFEDFTFSISDELAKTQTYKWNTEAVSDGNHVITVQSENHSVTADVKVDNTAPVITPSLTEGEEYKGAIEINAGIEDAIAGIAASEALLDGKKIQLPYSTASGKMTPGSHQFTVKAVDKAGNKAEKTIEFLTANENPDQIELIGPADGAEKLPAGDPLLQVKVTDPGNDRMDVSFYKGYQYDSADNGVKAFKNAADTEPPKQQAPAGEQPFTPEDITLTSEKDGSYLTTDSSTQFPYHRFDVTVVGSVDQDDRIELKWDGNSLEGRKVSMYAWNHEESNWSLIDFKVAGTEDFELSGDVTAGEFVKDSKINVLVQDEIPKSSEEYDYTFAWMSDTQYYSESYPHIYQRQTEWIAQKQEELKIKYVFHTGDLVNISTNEAQWQNADTSMKVLDDNNIPYGVLAGNHDVNQVSNDYTDYYRYFGEDRFASKDYYGGSYLNNRGHYDLISAGGNDYIMVYLGWGVTDEGIAWMNDVLAAYPERKAILNFHEYLLASGTRHPLGEKLYNEVVIPNKNVFAVLSGHYHAAKTYIDQIDDNGDGTPDRTVTQMLADYQAGPEGGQGYLRLLHFDQDNNRILVNTYSPYLDDYNYYDTDEFPGMDEFEISLDLAPSEKRIATDYFAVNVYTNDLIGKDEGVESGSIAETFWIELETGSTYSWYAAAEDSYTGSAVSDIWSFTKGEKLPIPEEEEPPAGGGETDPPPAEDGGLPGDNSGDPGSGNHPDHGSENPDDNSGGSGNPRDEIEPEDSKEHVASPSPQSPEKNAAADNDYSDSGSLLPSTGSAAYNLLAAGALFILAGASASLYKRRKRSVL
ncbi:lamin tail domain-containing protein [Metabacillus indicus]|uniref:lamin tail domain-containing protein n=1 Tax=Metabacillus indicus TaxID=246786 RepID=UPI002A0954AD|nr:lamin tail domain-containing protein [Metabacillus indicus]MDX8289405.1 lamin tail domain-containing protein [Metabacillus indicus]